MYDVHTHLTSSELLPDLDKLLAAAYIAGVRNILSVSEDLQDAPLVLALHQESQHTQGIQLHQSLGLHPEKASLSALPQMLSLIGTHQHSLACIGEIGLDFSPHILGKTEAEQDTTKQIQRDCMRAQVELAQELGLAVNVHSRSAGHHALTLLRECASVANRGPVRAILHAFDGKAHYAEEAAMWGMGKKATARAREGENSTDTATTQTSSGEADIEIYFSVPPCAKRSPLMQKWIKRIPLSRLLLETDCPALAPEKGEINVPANLAVSAAMVAELKGVTVEEVVAATNQNAEGLLRRRRIE